MAYSYLSLCCVQMSHDQPTSTELELPMTSHEVIAAVAEKELCLLDN